MLATGGALAMFHSIFYLLFRLRMYFQSIFKHHKTIENNTTLHGKDNPLI